MEVSQKSSSLGEKYFGVSSSIEGTPWVSRNCSILAFHKYFLGMFLKLSTSCALNIAPNLDVLVLFLLSSCAEEVEMKTILNHTQNHRVSRCCRISNPKPKVFTVVQVFRFCSHQPATNLSNWIFKNASTRKFSY